MLCSQLVGRQMNSQMSRCRMRNQSRNWLPNLLLLGVVCLFLWTAFDLTSSPSSAIIKPLPAQDQIGQANRRDQHVKSRNHQANLNQTLPKILCFVMSHDEEANRKKVAAIKKTWAGRLDKTLFVHNGIKTDSSDVVVVFGRESRNELWHKVMFAFNHIYGRYLDDYDWFMKVDDDTYVFTDNLKEFLTTKSPNEPIYFGERYNKYVRQGYMSGGSGYVLSREAVKRLIEIGTKSFRRECHLDDGSVEDVEIGNCLEQVGVKAGDTRDKLGRHTFLSLNPGYLLDSPQPQWYFDYLYYPHHTGQDCCSSKPISIHYVSPNEALLLDWLLNRVK